MLTFDEFCALPPQEIAEQTPPSMIFAAGGTRRAAALVGIRDQDEYVKWSAEQLLISFGLFAKYGVRHIVTHAIVPTQWNEETPGYREKLLGWISNILISDETLSAYKERNWRETMIGIESIPEFKPVAKTLKKIFPTKGNYDLTVHYAATPAYETHWADLSRILGKKNRSQDDLILAKYKEAIPPIKLYIGYGKPILSSAVCPPLLGAFDGMHCYWLQKPGFVTNEKSVLKILYDYAFTRRTWIKDKSGRTAKVLNFRDAMSRETILGVGMRLGPFWYPDYGDDK